MDIIDWLLLITVCSLSAFLLFTFLANNFPEFREELRKINRKRKASIAYWESKDFKLRSAKGALKQLRGGKGVIRIESERMAQICIDAITEAVVAGFSLRQIGTSSQEMMNFRSGDIPGFASSPDSE